MTERRYRRRVEYPAQLRATVRPATVAALEREADASDQSVSAVVRDAIDRGLPLVRDARRSRERSRRRSRPEPFDGDAGDDRPAGDGEGGNGGQA